MMARRRYMTDLCSPRQDGANMRACVLSWGGADAARHHEVVLVRTVLYANEATGYFVPSAWLLCVQMARRALARPT